MTPLARLALLLPLCAAVTPALSAPRDQADAPALAGVADPSQAKPSAGSPLPAWATGGERSSLCAAGEGDTCFAARLARAKEIVRRADRARQVDPERRAD